jgi:GNAT superfamily N-acetyltransferase
VAGTVEIRPLAADDERSGFSCGQPDLDRFFQHYAGQNQFKLHLAVTYLAVIDGRIAGFATVAASTLERATLPESRSKRRMPGYPLPVLRLARLGVDSRAQQLGIGKALLRHVLELALMQRDTLGCVGLVVDAKPDAAAYYQRFGFVRLDVREGELASEELALFLGIETVAASLSQRAV